MLEKIIVILVTYLGFSIALAIFKYIKEELKSFKKYLWIVKLFVISTVIIVFILFTKNYFSFLYLVIVILAEYFNFDYISYLAFSLLIALSSNDFFVFINSFLFLYNMISSFIFKIEKRNLFINIGIRIYYLPLSILLLVLLS